MNPADRKKLVDQICKECVDQGKLIEAGFAALHVTAISKDAPDVQIREMRMAFMAGAQHLFASIMCMMEPGAEPTELDMQRMNLIDAELKLFVSEMKVRFSPKG